jgi:hypothetical protein
MPYHRRSLILTIEVLPDLTRLVKSGQELGSDAAPKRSGTKGRDPFGESRASLEARIASLQQRQRLYQTHQLRQIAPGRRKNLAG